MPNLYSPKLNLDIPFVEEQTQPHILFRDVFQILKNLQRDRDDFVSSVARFQEVVKSIFSEYESSSLSTQDNHSIINDLSNISESLKQEEVSLSLRTAQTIATAQSKFEAAIMSASSDSSSSVQLNEYLQSLSSLIQTIEDNCIQDKQVVTSLCRDCDSLIKILTTNSSPNISKPTLFNDEFTEESSENDDKGSEFSPEKESRNIESELEEVLSFDQESVVSSLSNEEVFVNSPVNHSDSVFEILNQNFDHDYEHGNSDLLLEHLDSKFNKELNQESNLIDLRDYESRLKHWEMELNSKSDYLKEFEKQLKGYKSKMESSFNSSRSDSDLSDLINTHSNQSLNSIIFDLKNQVAALQIEKSDLEMRLNTSQEARLRHLFTESQEEIQRLLKAVAAKDDELSALRASLYVKSGVGASEDSEVEIPEVSSVKSCFRSSGSDFRSVLEQHKKDFYSIRSSYDGLL
ncbi:hypothetical protein RCL1_002283 [Eukaryota sp. TZLM3-RCL]